MRTLLKKQKEILEAEVRKDSGVYSWSDLPVSVIEKLESINDSEILETECTRFINDFRTFIY